MFQNKKILTPLTEVQGHFSSAIFSIDGSVIHQQTTNEHYKLEKITAFQTNNISLGILNSLSVL